MQRLRLGGLAGKNLSCMGGAFRLARAKRTSRALQLLKRFESDARGRRVSNIAINDCWNRSAAHRFAVQWEEDAKISAEADDIKWRRRAGCFEPKAVSRIGIAIPARDEAERIGDCLASLAAQRDALGDGLISEPFGVVVFLNGCNDCSFDVAASDGAPTCGILFASSRETCRQASITRVGRAMSRWRWPPIGSRKQAAVRDIF